MTLISTHGGYRTLFSFQTSTIVYDLTVEFCKLYVKEWRMRDQMIQAARSGRQNIAEGKHAAGTSSKTEMHLVNVARSSLEELLLDYQDYLRQRKLPIWDKDHPEALHVRKLAYKANGSDLPYRPYMAQPDVAANTLICLIYQTTYLLDRLLLKLQQDFLQNGGFSEKMYIERRKILRNQNG